MAPEKETPDGNDDDETLTAEELVAANAEGEEKDPADGTSFGATDDDDDGKQVVPATFPDDWREQMGGKNAKRLARYKSPAAVANALLAAQTKISSGEYKAKPVAPEKATDDELKAWREEHGVPAEARGYLENLPDGLVIGEADKPMADSWAAFAHAANLDPASTQAALAWYYKFEAEHIEALAAGDEQDKETADDELRAEWGSEYRAAENTIKNGMQLMPEGIQVAFLEARGADGRRLYNNPDMRRWLYMVMADQTANADALPGGDAGHGGQTVAGRIADIEKVMREDRTTYNADEAMQKELRSLYDRRDAANKKKKAA
tara:strand:- start:1193 stop:2152 length:960 start_codon:yes stop_codon:yes gene_type:complete